MTERFDQPITRERVESRIALLPELEVTDIENWVKAKEANGEWADYAESWGRLMQARIAEGESLQDIWHSTSLEVDWIGHSGGSLWGCASLLAEVWVHGEELRAAHDATTGDGSVAIFPGKLG